MDSAVLAVCGFAYGEEFPWEPLARKARKKIFFTDEFPRICGSCQWYALCRNTEISKDGGIL